MDIFTRSEALIGSDAFKKINNSHIVLCGVGGVGSYVFEALVRTGVGEITLIDSDTVSESNINRQLIATVDTVGANKTDIAQKRAQSINPDVKINRCDVFLDRDNICETLPENADFIIDAIDFVPAKVELARYAKEKEIPIISCLGTGNRLDATKFEVCDIYSTSGCPLARKMRYELKKAGVGSLDVLFSRAPVISHSAEFDEGKRAVGSVAFVPAVAGLIIAQHVILKIGEIENK